MTRKRISPPQAGDAVFRLAAFLAAVGFVLGLGTVALIGWALVRVVLHFT